MLSISKRLILRAIAVVSWIVSIDWYITKPEHEPLIAVLAGIIAFIGSYAVSDTPISILTSEKTKFAREQRNRHRMLELVRNSWVKGVLEQSLHCEVLIELGLEERRDAVYDQQGMELQRTGKPNRLLPAGTKVMDVFDEVGKTLLILGEPGSGKTTLLLELARDTIARAEKDPKHPIPVVFNLSSWTDTKQLIADWLVDELITKYYIPKETASDWIKNDELLLLLDGLDEVLPERREACACAINDFRHGQGLTPLVVCCRSEEYEALSSRLDLEGAVSLQPLTKEQVDNYLDRIGQDLAALRTAIEDDPILYELAQSPLMLSIMTLAYRGMSVHDLQPLETVDTRRKHIFDNYVERMLRPRIYRTVRDHLETDSAPDRKHDKRFSKEETIHWLSWLARRMLEHGQTVFLLERMEPDWLPTQAQQWIMTNGVAVIIALFFGLLFGLLSGGLFFGLLFGLFSGGLFFGLFFGLAPWLERLERERSHGTPGGISFGIILFSMLLGGLLFGLLLGLLSGRLLLGLFSGVLLFGLFFGLLFGLRPWLGGLKREVLYGSPGGILFGIILFSMLLGGLLFGIFDGLHSWLLDGLLFGLFFGLIGGLLYGLLVGTTGMEGGLLCSDTPGLILYSGLIGVLLFGPFGVLLGGLIGGLLEVIHPTETLGRGLFFGLFFGLFGMLSGAVRYDGLPVVLSGVLRYGLFFGLLGGLFGALDFGLFGALDFRLFFGLFIGLLFGLSFGGHGCIRHTVLRTMLWRCGFAPLRYARFLDYAAERIFLRKVGSEYIFVHKLLMEYFASLEPEACALVKA